MSADFGWLTADQSIKCLQNGKKLVDSIQLLQSLFSCDTDKSFFLPQSNPFQILEKEKFLLVIFTTNSLKWQNLAACIALLGKHIVDKEKHSDDNMTS